MTTPSPARCAHTASTVGHTRGVPSDTGFLHGPYPRAFVHRGWHAGDLAGMENSLSAFRRAVQEGYHYLELDVHATRDGVLVVHHDTHLDRTTDQSGALADQPWNQVRQAKIGGREPVCRLEDLLEELPTALLNIDVKAESAIEPLISVLRATNAMHRVCVASFSESRLARIRRWAGDGLLTSLGTRAVVRLWAAGRLPASWFPGPISRRVAQVPLRHGRLTVVDRRLISAAQRRGMEVHVWTIDDAARMHQLIDLGVDGIMTDRPDILRQVLTERGLWPGVHA